MTVTERSLLLTGAAAKLGIPASTLKSKIRQLGIEKRKFSPDSQ